MTTRWMDSPIGGLRLQNLSIAFADAPPFRRLGLDERPAMLLGMNELRAFRRVAIDFATRKVLFDLPDDEVTGFRDRVRAVTPEAARDVGRRYFPLEDRVVVAVGPARSIARGLERFGAVTVVPARKMA